MRRAMLFRVQRNPAMMVWEKGDGRAWQLASVGAFSFFLSTRAGEFHPFSIFHRAFVLLSSDFRLPLRVDRIAMPECDNRLPNPGPLHRPGMIEKLEDIGVFVRTADNGSLSAAARALDITPAVASAALKRLEAALGTRTARATSTCRCRRSTARRYSTTVIRRCGCRSPCIGFACRRIESGGCRRAVRACGGGFAEHGGSQRAGAKARVRRGAARGAGCDPQPGTAGRSATRPAVAGDGIIAGWRAL